METFTCNRTEVWCAPRNWADKSGVYRGHPSCAQSLCTDPSHSLHIWPWCPILCLQWKPSSSNVYSTAVTSLVRSPQNYGHPWSVPNCILQWKLAPCNKVTSPLMSRLPSPAGDRISEIPLYTGINAIKFDTNPAHTIKATMRDERTWLSRTGYENL